MNHNYNDHKYRMEKRIIRMEAKQNTVILLLCMIFVAIVFPTIGGVLLGAAALCIVAAVLGKTIGQSLSKLSKSKNKGIQRFDGFHPSVHEAFRKKPKNHAA